MAERLDPAVATDPAARLEAAAVPTTLGDRHEVTEHWDAYGGEILHRTCTCGRGWVNDDVKVCPEAPYADDEDLGGGVVDDRGARAPSGAPRGGRARSGEDHRRVLPRGGSRGCGRPPHGRHASARRTHCPRGHILKAPNLRRGQMKAGKWMGDLSGRGWCPRCGWSRTVHPDPQP